MDLTAVIDSFDLLSPAQQLADRFLLGYPWRGEFVAPRVPLRGVVPLTKAVEDSEALRERVRSHRDLSVSNELGEAVRGRHVLVVTSKERRAEAVRSVLEKAERGQRVFVWGALVSASTAAAATKLAADRGVELSAGTYVPMTWRLPGVDVPEEARVEAAVVATVGDDALEYGVEALFSLVERRAGGEAGVRSLRMVEGANVWRMIDRDASLSYLVAAAVSRTDTPLGDPERDGRTQDIFGLGLLPRLVEAPRALVLDHDDGLRSVVLVLDGALRDFNFALRTGGGDIVSAQIYRPPAPNEHHFSCMAGVVEMFFLGGPQHPSARDRLVAAVLGAGPDSGSELKPRLTALRCGRSLPERKAELGGEFRSLAARVGRDDAGPEDSRKRGRVIVASLIQR